MNNTIDSGLVAAHNDARRAELQADYAHLGEQPARCRAT